MPSSDGLGILHGAPALARAVERGFVLLAGGIGLRLGGLLLGARAFEGGARDVAGGHQVLVALGVGGGLAGLCLRGFQGGAGGDRFRHQGGIERALAAEADARLGLAHAGGGLVQRGAWPGRGGAGRRGDRVRRSTCPCLTKSPTLTGVAMHAPGNQRRDVAGFVGDEGAGLLEGGRDGAGDGLRRA